MGKPEEKQVADEEIITQIKAWAETCRKGTMLLTTSDGDYGELMTSLEKSGNIRHFLIYISDSLNYNVDLYQKTNKYPL